MHATKSILIYRLVKFKEESFNTTDHEVMTKGIIFVPLKKTTHEQPY